MSFEIAGRGRRVAGLLILAGALPLAAAFAFQYLGGLAPCPLCLYQRYPYGVVIAIGVVALGFAGDGRLVRSALVAAAVAFFVDAGIAAFHVGVERHWWQGLAACQAQIDLGADPEELKELLLNAPLVSCDKVAWSLLGVSMAGYNFLYASAAGILALGIAARGSRPGVAGRARHRHG